MLPRTGWVGATKMTLYPAVGSPRYVNGRVTRMRGEAYLLQMFPGADGSKRFAGHDGWTILAPSTSNAQGFKAISLLKTNIVFTTWTTTRHFRGWVSYANVFERYISFQRKRKHREVNAHVDQVLLAQLRLIRMAVFAIQGLQSLLHEYRTDVLERKKQAV